MKSMNLNSSSKIFITGGTGHLGKELRKVLTTKDLNVIILSRKEVALEKNEVFKKFELGEDPFDYNLEEDITFLHLAHDFYDYKSNKENINYIGQRKIVDSLKKIKKKKIIYFSTPLLQNNTYSIYHEQKVLGEEVAKEIDHLILKPSFIFSDKGGANSIFNKLTKIKLPIPLPRNKNKISPISLYVLSNFVFDLIFIKQKSGSLILKGLKDMNFKDFLSKYHGINSFWVNPYIFIILIKILILCKSTFFFYIERMIGVIHLEDINEICKREEFKEIT